ncbi:MAG: tRNA (cytidine(34)-2'-O)-methyltransferase [Alphaproteobacteria bacterium]|nr:tRNA (cytidine(34)-2'-O)-methyltransferase [Alphaproteobacteria bacterium]
MIKIALYQPDIPQNVGAMMRLAACMDISLDIIEPCGFPWNKKKIQSSAMDYINSVTYERSSSWEAFLRNKGNRRLILMTTKSKTSYLDFKFSEHDILLAGSESSGVPDFIHDAVDASITIPMKAGLRSLNIVNATSMILGEALRQTR